MVRKVVLTASLAVGLSFTASAGLADEMKPLHKHNERRVGMAEREAGLSRRPPVRLHYRYVYRSPGFHRRHYRHVRSYAFVRRAWDGVYGSYPRRHFFVDGVYTTSFFGPVNYGFVTYRTYIYYTPTYPSVIFGYPPYAYVYGLAPGPVYNKPCLC